MSAANSHTDQELIAKAKKDRHAFSALYERYFVRVFQFVYQRVGDQNQASDLTSQTFLKAMLHLHKYEDRGVPFIAWLLRIASNEVNQFFRKSKKVVEVEIDDQQLSRLAEDLQIEIDEPHLEQMIEALNHLGLEESQLIELRFFEGNSFKEIAELYGLTEANAKMKVYRILKKLKKQIERASSK